jgi:hypothetical protein
MPKLTARVIFKSPEDGPDRQEALVWANAGRENLLEALQECPRGDWFIWMMTYSKVNPRLLLEITYQCALTAISGLEKRPSL